MITAVTPVDRAVIRLRRTNRATNAAHHPAGTLRAADKCPRRCRPSGAGWLRLDCPYLRLRNGQPIGGPWPSGELPGLFPLLEGRAAASQNRAPLWGEAGLSQGGNATAASCRRSNMIRKPICAAAPLANKRPCNLGVRGQGSSQRCREGNLLSRVAACTRRGAGYLRRRTSPPPRKHMRRPGGRPMARRLKMMECIVTRLCFRIISSKCLSRPGPTKKKGPSSSSSYPSPLRRTATLKFKR
jgi:hypothetical protein